MKFISVSYYDMYITLKKSLLLTGSQLTGLTVWKVQVSDGTVKAFNAVEGTCKLLLA